MFIADISKKGCFNTFSVKSTILKEVKTIKVVDVSLVTIPLFLKIL